jgi:DNA adenine methylase
LKSRHTNLQHAAELVRKGHIVGPDTLILHRAVRQHIQNQLIKVTLPDLTPCSVCLLLVQKFRISGPNTLHPQHRRLGVRYYVKRKNFGLFVKKTSILRWSGSKTKLLPDLRRLAPIKYERYIEPFAGSASLFFEIEPKIAILGDINTCVIDMYRAIQENPDGVADTLYGIPKSSEAYYTLRAILPNELTLEQRAARLIFLMKSCFNGVYRTNKIGKFNVPMGDKIYSLPTREELRSAQSILKGAQLMNKGFESTLEFCRKGDWIYLDPPYRTLGRYRGEYGYSAKFCDGSIESFLDTVKRLSNSGCLVTISYCYDESFIQSLSGWHITSVNAARSVAGQSSKRTIAREIILRNFESIDNDANH